MADSAAEEKLAQRQVAKYPQHGTARHGTARHGTARHGTARHGTARRGLAAFQDRLRQRHASECVGGRRTQAIRSIRTGITWKVESATTAHGPSCSSAVTPHPAHSAGTPAAGAACSSTARINAAVDAPTSPSACTAAVDALASRRCHGFGLRVGCPRLFAHTVAILDNLGKSRE
jgi:hypothetical protein